jgi:YD repeat-containing protein
MASSTGDWTVYAYNSFGEMSAVYTPYGNSPAPSPGSAPSSNYRMTQYSYLNYNPTGAMFPANDVPTCLPALARMEQVFVNTGSGSNEISRLYRSVPSPTEVDVWQCMVPGASWENSLRTATETASDATDMNLAGQPLGVVRPDGTATLYQYNEDANGVLTNVIVQTGCPDNTNTPTRIIDGTLTSYVYSPTGAILSSTTLSTDCLEVEVGNAIPPDSILVSNVGWSNIVQPVLARQTYTYLDPLQRNYEVVDLANRMTTVLYSCCGVGSVCDPDGVLTSYNYDEIGRLTGQTTSRGSASVMTLNNLDAAGRTLVSQIQGTSGGIITNQQTSYDTLGRPMFTTNALGGVTTNIYAYVTLADNSIQQSNVVIYPDGGSATYVYYSDGRPASVSGTAVSPVTYQYGIDNGAGDRQWHEYTLTTKITASGTNEWTKTYTDGAGHSFETVYSAPSGPAPVSISYYNGLGQLASQVDPDGFTHLFQYDDQGRQCLTTIANHITLTTNDVVLGANRTQVFEWRDDGSACLVSTRMTSVDGLADSSTVYGLTSATVTAYSGGNHRTVTASAADGSYSVSVYQYGQLLSTTRYDANGQQLGGTTYGYDQFGRQNTATDARNGTTTTWFNNMNQVSVIATPPPASGQSPEVTSNYFDLMGRIIMTKLPDGTFVTNQFAPTGQAVLTDGSRTYPVGYGYDAQGRMQAMTNWTAFPSSGAEVTAWSYDPYRGWLSSKSDASNNGPSYTYTQAGRLQSRYWARGPETAYGYNTDGSLAATEYYDGITPSVTWDYDSRGREIWVTDGPRSISRTLNDAGEATFEWYFGGLTDGLWVESSYDGLLRRTGINFLISAPFDRLGRDQHRHLFLCCQFLPGGPYCLCPWWHERDDHA